MKVSRRDFLVAAAFAGSGLHLAGDWSLPVAASDRVRVGVIAPNVQSLNLSRYAEIGGMEVVGLSNPSVGLGRDRRSSLQGLVERLTTFNRPALYADWRSLVDRPDIDALFLSAGGQEQSRIAVTALDSGKHVLLERPGRLVDQLKTIADTAHAQQRLAAHSYGAQFIGITDAKSEALLPIHGLMTARARHAVSIAYEGAGVLDPAAQRREFLLNPVAQFDYARGVLGVTAPSSISCVAMRQPHDDAITRAALRFEFAAANTTKAIEIDIAGHNGSGNHFHRQGFDAQADEGSIVFAGLGSGFAVRSINNSSFTLATWSNFVDCVRSKQPAGLVAPVSELTASLSLLQLAEQPCTSGRTLFLNAAR